MKKLKNKFNNSYLMINMIKNKINISSDNEIIEKNVYSLVGIDLIGNRDFLGFYIDKNNDNRFFLNLFETLKSKGINKIYYFIANDDGKLKRALNISYPSTIIITNLTMNIASLWYHISYRSRNDLISKLKKLYVQDNYDNAYILECCLKEDFNDNALVLLLLDKYFSNIKDYYQYDVDVRNFLFNHNSFTDFYDKIKSVSKERMFNDENDLYKEFNDYIEAMEKNRLYDKKKWSNILNHCSKYFPNLLEEVANIL